MKKQLLIISLVFIALFGFSFLLKPGGSPGNYTGSPGDNGETCASCHGGTPLVQYSWINSNIPTNGFMPGTIYTINLLALDSVYNKFGFEIIAEDTAGNSVGTFGIINSTETQIAPNGVGVTHTAGGTTGSANSKSWSVQWTAPPAGTGMVTFYVAYLVANNDNTSSGDAVYYTTMPVLDQIGSNISEAENNEIEFFPNPTSDFINIKNVKKNTIYTIYDLNGKLISSGEITNSTTINVQSLQNGVYTLNLLLENNKVITKKFVKE